MGYNPMNKSNTDQYLLDRHTIFQIVGHVALYGFPHLVGGNLKIKYNENWKLWHSLLFITIIFISFYNSTMVR